MSMRLGLKKRLGLALSLSTLDPSNSGTGGGVPAGYTRTTVNGVPVSFNGAPVFDDGKNFYYRRSAA